MNTGNYQRAKSMSRKRLYRVRGEENLPALRAPCQNFYCSRRFQRACHNQALPTVTHRVGKRPGCASWSRGPAEALAVLRPRTRPQPPTVSLSSVHCHTLPLSSFLWSLALLSPCAAQVHCSLLLSHTHPRLTASFVPICSHAAG